MGCIIYSKNKSNLFYVQVGDNSFIIGMKGIRILKSVSFNEICWNYFKELIEDKSMIMLQIAEEIFGESRNIKLEQAIWTMMEMLMDENNKLVQAYFEYHAKLCFSEFWIHRYAYFQYHGFNLTKGAFFRSKLDRKNGFSCNSKCHISNIINFGIYDDSLQIKIYPKTRYDLKLNIDNSGWKNISLDAKKNFQIEKSVKRTKNLLARIECQLLENSSLLVIAKDLDIAPGIVIMYALVAYSKLFNASIKKALRHQMLNNEEISLSRALRYHINQDTNLLYKIEKYYPEAYANLIRVTSKYQNIQKEQFLVFNKMITSKYSNEYRIGYIKNNKWRTFTLELANISQDEVSNDIKDYSQYVAVKGLSLNLKIVAFYRYTKARTNKFNIKASEITENDLLVWFENIAKYSKLKSVKNSLSAFYTFLINKSIVDKSKDVYKLKAIKKIFSSEIIIKDDQSNPTIPLPEDVYIQIRSHLDELPSEIKNAFLIIIMHPIKRTKTREFFIPKC